MPMFVCTQIENNVCTDWVQQFGFLPALTAEQGIQIGGSLLLCMATAWGVRMLVRFLANR